MGVSAHPTPTHTMWQKLKEQIPAIVLTALIILGISYWFSQKAAAEAAAQTGGANEGR